jgi:hypothetical protein
MVLDIRAKTTCNLGEVITASISDDFIQLNGLIKTQGSCEIKGLIVPDVGDQVTFQYEKNGITKSIPRALRVLSSFANPYTNTTTVSLGCKLTYLSNKTAPVNWSQYDDPLNQDEEPSRIVVFPIRASSVMNECLTELGIVANRNPLTNQFSVEEFDFSSGYVQILSDLLVSEGYYGILNEQETLIIESLDETVINSVILTADDLVSISDINSGELPTDSVVVSYSTVRLNAPSEEEGTEEEDEEGKKVAWDYSESYTENVKYRLNCKNADGEDLEFQWVFSPYTIEIAEYDDWDRLKKREAVTTGILADFANSFLSDYCSRCGMDSNFLRQLGAIEYKTKTIDLPNYVIPAYGTKPEEGADKVSKDESYTYEPDGKVFSGISFNYKDMSNMNAFIGQNERLTSKTIVKYTHGDVNQAYYYGAGPGATDAGRVQSKKYPTNKTTTTSYKAYGYTSEGQMALSKETESGGSFWTLRYKAVELTLESVAHNITTGRQIGLQQKPSKTANILKDAAKNPSEDANDGYSTSAVSDLELSSGSSGAQRRTEFNMPYAPDDTFYRYIIGQVPGTTTIKYGWKSIPSSAPAKARNFGRVQNRLLVGNRYGMNIQTSPDKIPLRPMKPVTIYANGLSGLYMTNGLNWTIDAQGILVSIDALFWQPIGGTGNFWFPVAPGVTTLPVTPPAYQLEGNVIGSVSNVYGQP